MVGVLIRVGAWGTRVTGRLGRAHAGVAGTRGSEGRRKGRSSSRGTSLRSGARSGVSDFPLWTQVCAEVLEKLDAGVVATEELLRVSLVSLVLAPWCNALGSWSSGA